MAPKIIQMIKKNRKKKQKKKQRVRLDYNYYHRSNLRPMKRSISPWWNVFYQNISVEEEETRNCLLLACKSNEGTFLNLYN